MVEQDPDTGFYYLAIGEESEFQDFAMIFYARATFDTETFNFMPSETDSTLYIVDDSYFGDTLRIELPYTTTVITPIPAKYLTETPIEVFANTERVVGTFNDETLYEQVYTINYFSGETAEIEVKLPSGYIKSGYIADAFTEVLEGGNFFKSYPQYYYNGDYDEYFYCILEGNKIIVNRDMPYHEDYYDLHSVIKIRYTKKDVLKDHTIKVNWDKQWTGSEYLLGNIEYAGSLGLVAGNTYNATVTIDDKESSVTVTATDAGNDIVEVDFGSDYGDMIIYDNAYWDYRITQPGEHPHLTYREGVYCFECSQSLQYSDAIFDIITTE